MVKLPVKKMLLTVRVNRMILATLLFLSIGCSALPVFVEGGSGPNSKRVLFSDDFSDTGSGWSTYHQADAIIQYDHGGLRFILQAPDYDFWSVPGKRFTNSRTEVDVTKISGPDDNDFGLICRYQNQQYFYAFLISSDGYYGILKVKDGVYSLLSGDSLQFSDAIRIGQSTNHLRADCIGTQLVFYVNNQFVATAQDSDLPDGENGLMAGTYDQPGVDVLFDNFVVLNP